MKRWSKWLALSLCALALLAGCGGQEKEIDINQVAQGLAQLPQDDELLLATEKVAEKFYGLPIEGVSAYQIYVSSSGATANEIALFQVEDGKMDGVKAAVDQRVADLTKNFESYVPAELFRIENRVVVEEGNYLLLAIVEDGAKAEEQFLAAFE